MPSLHLATRDDAKPLAELAERVFRQTFGPVNTVEDMDLHCRTTYGEALQAEEIADPSRLTLLGKHDGEIVGFAQMRWSESPDCVRGRCPGEIQRLYVAGEWHGKGVAQALMNTCLQEMRARGVDVVWLGVWEHNPRAIAFYRKFGFTEAGAHVFTLGRDPQRDIVMVRRGSEAGPV